MYLLYDTFKVRMILAALLFVGAAVLWCVAKYKERKRKGKVLFICVDVQHDFMPSTGDLYVPRRNIPALNLNLDSHKPPDYHFQNTVHTSFWSPHCMVHVEKKD